MLSIAQRGLLITSTCAAGCSRLRPRVLFLLERDAASAARLTWRSSYLLSIASIVVLYEVVSNITDYQFNTFVARRYTQDVAMAAFLGRFSTASIGATAVAQIVLTVGLPSLVLCLAVCISITLTGCTHLTPYYRRGLVRRVAAPTPEKIDHRLLLIGDAGDPDPDGEPVLQLLRRRAAQIPARTTVVFLGDNVYERGMPKVEKSDDDVADVAEKVVDTVLLALFTSRRAAEKVLNAQLDVVRGTEARAIFVPGNHARISSRSAAGATSSNRSGTSRSRRWRGRRRQLAAGSRSYGIPSSPLARLPRLPAPPVRARAGRRRGRLSPLA